MKTDKTLRWLIRIVLGGLVVSVVAFNSAWGWSMANPNNEPPVLGPFFAGVMWIALAITALGLLATIGYVVYKTLGKLLQRR